LLYLACVDIETDLTSQQRFQRAKDLSISAFLADSIYNFGELVGHLDHLLAIEADDLHLDHASDPGCFEDDTG
jgi:hypothetical protein